MTNQELEQKIRTAVEHAAPNQLDSILSSCDQHKKKGNVIHMSENKNLNSKKKYYLTAIVAVAAVVLLLIGAYPILQRNIISPTDSVIMLDVNPSLALRVNSKEKVTSVEALNEDAKEILQGMELKGTSLETAVNAIIGSMLQKGYLSELQNSILVSVENHDATRSEQLQQKVSELISNATQNSSLDSAVLSQTINDTDTELSVLAQNYNISLGKAALIQEVIAQDPMKSFEELAGLNINELALIISSQNLSSELVTQTGIASDKTYIGREEALNIAYAHSGVVETDILEIEAELDSEHGVMIYEVEFETNTTKYEYDINASTGEIINFEQQTIKNTKETSSTDKNTETSNSSYISESTAKEAALAHAQVNESDTRYIHCYIDYDNGKAKYYKVKFVVENTQYDYKIDLYSAAIIECEIESYNKHDSEISANNDSYIGEDAALSIVLTHTSMEESNLTKKQIKLDKDRDRIIYNIELESKQIECEYKIDAVTGEIIEAEFENSSRVSQPNNASYIGEDAALSIVLTHANMEESNLTRKQITLDKDDGIMIYKIELKSNQTEYEYELDAVTGTILEAKIETQ